MDDSTPTDRRGRGVALDRNSRRVGRHQGGISSATPLVPVQDEGEPLLRLYAERGGELAIQAAQIVLASGAELADLHLARPSLEDVFIHLTGKGLRD